MDQANSSPGSTDFHIRRGLPQDAALISEIGRITFSAAFGAQNNPEDLAAHLDKTFNLARLERELSSPDNTYLIAESEKKPVGYARLQNNPAPAGIPGSNPIELVRFYVMPEYIGKGYGSRLLQACLDLAWGGGHDVIWLSTWKINERGLSFYRKWGFEIVGEQIFMVGSDPQEDYLLALRRK